ncbi:hypothetical protein ACFVVJ_21280 [Streptomyces albidoflavus]|uniref:hypothetical protein n=1 Tax=Streptomyces albidoflavus TaxID=1886 RepID=UPI0004C7BC8F|nr:hypothetical protein [Streptomyces albidoflavus]
MVFGKKRSPSLPPVAAVDWRPVHRVMVSGYERPETRTTKRSVMGSPAIRTPGRDEAGLILAPCAFIGRDADTARLPDASHTLFLNEERTRLLCWVGVPRQVDGDDHFSVHGPGGEALGVVCRVSGRLLRRHTWRIEQPGQPEITGVGEWTRAREEAGPVGKIGSFAGQAFDALAGGDGEDMAERKLVWHAGQEKVMDSRGGTVDIRAEWLDRRLAFTFALIGDAPVPR